MNDNSHNTSQSEQYNHYMDQIHVSDTLHKKLLDIPDTTATKPVNKPPQHRIKYITTTLASAAVLFLVVIVLRNYSLSSSDKSGSSDLSTKNEITESLTDSSINDSYTDSDTAIESDRQESSTASEKLTTDLALLPNPDCIVVDSKLYVNVSTDTATYTKGEIIGEVMNTLDPEHPTNNTASTLPIGTRLYQCNEDSSILAAETKDGIQLYKEWNQ